MKKTTMYMCRNPYFIGINSAISMGLDKVNRQLCRNPYFIGINSAIEEAETKLSVLDLSQSLFYWN